MVTPSDRPRVLENAVGDAIDEFRRVYHLRRRGGWFNAMDAALATALNVIAQDPAVIERGARSQTSYPSGESRWPEMDEASRALALMHFAADLRAALALDALGGPET